MKNVRKLITSTVLASALALGFASTASAEDTKPVPVGDSYMRGATPHEVAEMVRAYFKSHPEDPEGRKLLDPSKCHVSSGRSCASAWSYFSSLQYDDPDAGLTSISQLADYLDSLVLMTPTNEEYNMDALTPIGDDRFNVLAGVLHRHFKKGADGKLEQAWGNPKTHKIVFAQDCGNPVGTIYTPVMVNAGLGGSKDNPGCWEVHLSGDKGGNLHIGVDLPKDESLAEDTHHCLADFPPCQGNGCEFPLVEKVTGMQIKKEGELMNLQTDGDHVILIPMNWAASICYTDANGETYMVKTVLPPNFNHGVAYVLRQGDQPQPGALYWHHQKS